MSLDKQLSPQPKAANYLPVRGCMFWQGFVVPVSHYFSSIIIKVKVSSEPVVAQILGRYSQGHKNSKSVLCLEEDNVIFMNYDQKSKLVTKRRLSRESKKASRDYSWLGYFPLLSSMAEVTNTGPTGQIQPSTLFYLARHLVSTLRYPAAALSSLHLC